ncbi:MAG: OmpA family protein [Phycisphaerae bacterium]|jgi:chemotaxis protein MotB
MAIKKKPPPAGAPDWVLTYGDMMSLLLCFFILLAAFADFEAGGSQDKRILAIASIQEALGIRTSGSVRDKVVQFNTLIDQLRQAIKELKAKAQGDAVDRGLHGRNFRLRRIRDGMEMVIGGPILFDLFSSRLNDAGQEAVTRIGEVLKGHRNMVEVRGHANDGAGTPEWSPVVAMRLAHARAEAVAQALIDGGIDPRTLRLVAVGDNEPIPRDAEGPDRRADGRRVEIIVRESLLDDYR